jgi:peptide/nickel transport system permease protein
VHGNFGTSLVYKQSVASLIAPRLLTTLLLVGYAGVIITMVGVSLGVIGGMSPRAAPYVAGLNGLGVAIPGFVAAEVLTAVFAVKLGWFPVLGTGQGMVGRLQHLTLPACALAIASIAYVSQITRAAVSDEEQSSHVETARGRGLAGPRILRRHVLRNAAIPIMTVSALTVASLLAGAIVVEYAFGLGGIGSLLVQSVSDKDSSVVLAIGLILVLVFVITTTALDLLQYLLDPRLRLKVAASWR